MAKSKAGRQWSREVTRGSNALDLEEGVFTWKNPAKIARSLKHSAETSTRRKTDPYRSAMSMLTFYLNRAGESLPRGQKSTLNAAKDELRKQFKKA